MATKTRNRKKAKVEDIDVEDFIEEMLEEPEVPRVILPRIARRSFESPEALLSLAEDYFSECAKNKWDLPNKAGLALYLACSKDTLSKYGKEMGDDYADAIKTIYHRIENAWVGRLSMQHPTGAIFYLKNAFRYVDEIKQDISGININFIIPPEIASRYVAPQVEAPKPVEAIVIPEAVVEAHEVPPSTVTSSE